MVDPLIPFDPQSLLSTPYEEVALRRLRVGARQRIKGADLYHSLVVSAERTLDPFYALADDLVMSVVGHVYAEDLPPETIKHTTEVVCDGVVLVEFPVPSTWWQHWKQATAGRWWRRAFLWWLRPVRDRIVTVQQPWTQARRVSCTTDLRRFYIYPESKLGTSGIAGPVRVAKHEVHAYWTDQEVPR